MTAINFPDSPSNGDTHTVGGVTYTYNSAETKWKTTINSNAFLPLTGGTVSGNIDLNGNIDVEGNVVLNGELQHSGDTDTKITFGTDTINLDTAGSTRATVDSSGRLLVGTSSWTGTHKLSVQANSNSSTGSGNVALIRGESAADMSTGDVLGRIEFLDQDGGRYAFIDGRTDAASGANDNPGLLTFSTTADGASSPTGRMSITRAGTVSLPSNGASNIFGTPRLAVEGDVSQASAYFRQATTSDIAHIEFRNNNGVVGSIRTSGSSTDYSTSSDYRLKENVVPVTDGITRLQQLNPARFNFIADPDKTVDGFLAHEVQDVVPEAISGEKDAVDDEGNPVYQGIDQSKLVPLLTAALQEAISKIESLETRIAQLEGGTP
jgi:hypothetical protein